MKCPKCQTENPETRKFCRECGAKFSLICGECGHELSQPVVTPPVDYDQPQSYTPKFLAEKILTIRSTIEGEWKPATV